MHHLAFFLLLCLRACGVRAALFELGNVCIEGYGSKESPCELFHRLIVMLSHRLGYQYLLGSRSKTWSILSAEMQEKITVWHCLVLPRPGLCVGRVGPNAEHPLCVGTALCVQGDQPQVTQLCLHCCLWSFLVLSRNSHSLWWHETNSSLQFAFFGAGRFCARITVSAECCKVRNNGIHSFQKDLLDCMFFIFFYF